MFKWLLGGYMPSFKDGNGNVVENSVSKLQKLTLGGIEQWITIRGKHKDLPILLFFHGGPGSPQTGAQRKYNAELEKHFLVVNWDQRGAGKSYSPHIPAETMNFQQLLSDAHELVTYLNETYQKDKIFLMGHSFGAVLGILFAQQYPKLIHAYVGINQPVFREEEEERSYKYTLEMARETGTEKAIRQLEEIGAPIKGSFQSIEKGLVTQRKWLTKFNGVTYQKSANSFNMKYFTSSHLTLKEKVNFLQGFGFSVNHLWAPFASVNLCKTNLVIEVPIYLIAGRHDKIVFPDLVEKYFHQLEAPYKKMYLFENSGHFAIFEEAERFHQIMIGEVLQEIIG